MRRVGKMTTVELHDEDPGKLIAVARGLKGLLASIHRVLAVASAAEKNHVLLFISDFQRRLFAIDRGVLGQKLHALPLMPESMSTEEILERLHTSTRTLREAFMRTCIDLDGAWGSTLEVLPRTISHHALLPVH